MDQEGGTMTFSVIIPVYNGEKTLDRCIRSVLPQMQEGDGLFLVDDGSRDGSGLLCRRYAQTHPNRVQVIHQCNKGPFQARAAGLALAKGDYILFLDCDDAFLPGLLDRLRQVIGQTGADLVLFHHCRVSCNGAAEVPPCPFSWETGLGALRQALVAGEQLNSLWQKCVRRDRLPDPDWARAFGNLTMGEDKLLSLEILDRAETPVCIPEVFCRYSISPESLSRQRTWKQVRDLWPVTVKTLEYAARWNVPWTARAKRLLFLPEFAAGCLIRWGKRCRHAD